MVEQRWAPLVIEQTITTYGYKIVVYTDVPVHLTLYWSPVPPWLHRRSRTERGLPLMEAAYWCFQDWFTVEQIEAGDTLAHTFLWSGWEHCQTKWFTFRGTIGGIPSPSNSPIFNKHWKFADAPVGGTIIVFPMANGTIQELTQQFPNIGHHWDKLCEDPHDSDTTYMFSTAAADYHDTYALDFDEQPGFVLAIRVAAMFKNASGWPDNERVDYGYRLHNAYYSPIAGYFKPPMVWWAYSNEWLIDPFTGLPFTWPDLADLELMISLRGGFGLETRCTQIYLEIDW